MIVREAMCPQLPLTLVRPSDAQLICGGPPQNTGSFKLDVLMVFIMHFSTFCSSWWWPLVLGPVVAAADD